MKTLVALMLIFLLTLPLFRPASAEGYTLPGPAEDDPDVVLSDSFFARSVPLFLNEAGATNRVWSPLNVYLALGMLAETTDGESRAQLLALLGADSVEELRAQAQAVWAALDPSDPFGETEEDVGGCELAGSLWMDEAAEINPEVQAALAESYHAEAVSGKMGSPELDAALQAWLNEHTGDLLAEQAASQHLTPDTVLALATTVCFRGSWTDEFNPDFTEPGTFHSPEGDIERDFMHGSSHTLYYQADGFTAARRGLFAGQNGYALWLILPDEGLTPADLLAREDALRFLLAPQGSDVGRYVRVNFTLPRFDITSDIDLSDGLKQLGVTDVFDFDRSDFSPLLLNEESLAVTQASHAARAAIDEDGMIAAAYTVFAIAAGASPMQEEVVNFVVDRPFLFALTDYNDLPLFVGAVYAP